MPRVSISGTDLSFEVKEDEVLYDALYDQGHELPHGCLSGSCGACRVEVLEGSDNLAPAGVIEADTVEALKDEFQQLYGKEFIEGKTIRLACRAKVKGDLSFRPIK